MWRDENDEAPEWQLAIIFFEASIMLCFKDAVQFDISNLIFVNWELTSHKQNCIFKVDLWQASEIRVIRILIDWDSREDRVFVYERF